MTPPESGEQAVRWLTQDALPLWSTKGFDSTTGSFEECLSREGQALPAPRRAMVQARQIYSFCEAARLHLLEPATARELVDPAARFLVDRYSTPSGAFIHSVDSHGRPLQTQPDLYAQAFAIFGLANAFGLSGATFLKERARQCLMYLNSERRAAAGGYTELVDGRIAFQANPHMHLLEAALAWLRVDDDPDEEWLDLAKQMLDLCLSKFIDPVSGALCEHFDDPDWIPRREHGSFFFEPGHHYEWAWLMVHLEEVAGVGSGSSPRALFELAEACGVNAESGLTLDEVWSDLCPKRRSSRFWPQSERVKAALALGRADIADRALRALFHFLNVPATGLWEDTVDETGAFVPQPVKASSLYHIISAISEYVSKRPALGLRPS